MTWRLLEVSQPTPTEDGGTSPPTGPVVGPHLVAVILDALHHGPSLKLTAKAPAKWMSSLRKKGEKDRWYQPSILSGAFGTASFSFGPRGGFLFPSIFRVAQFRTLGCRHHGHGHRIHPGFNLVLKDLCWNSLRGGYSICNVIRCSKFGFVFTGTSLLVWVSSPASLSLLSSIKFKLHVCKAQNLQLCCEGTAQGHSWMSTVNGFLHHKSDISDRRRFCLGKASICVTWIM